MRNKLPMIFSTTALVIVLFGATPLGKAAYDAAVPRNSVGTLQLKRNAVTSSKLAPNTVRTGQVVDGSLLTADFKAGQIPQGPKGDKGDKGSKGDRGPVGISGYEIVTQSQSVPASTATLVQADCPAGKVVIGGGVTVQGIGGVKGVFLGSIVSNSGTGKNDIFNGNVLNSNTSAKTVFSQAICAKVAG